MSELNIPGFIAFLRGEVTIDGHWFGGDGPIRGGIRRNFWWREHLPKLSSHIERQDAEIAQLRADLSESRRLLDEARAQKPVGTVCEGYESECGEHYQWVRMLRTVPEGTKLYAATPVPAQSAAVPEAVAKDAARLDFLIAERAIVENHVLKEGARFWVSWPVLGEDQRGLYKSPREAIDAAILSAADSRSPDKCQCNAEGEVTDACKDCPR